MGKFKAKVDGVTPGSVWQHKNGEYIVLMLTNVHSTNDRYPVTVVYSGKNGNVWSRPLSDWHRSMTQNWDMEEVTDNENIS